jgi:hypothetical protein
MNEYLGSVISAERAQKYEDTHCPRSYCRHEFRDEQQPRKPILIKKA